MRGIFPEGQSYTTLGDSWLTFGRNLGGTAVSYVFRPQRGIEAKDIRLAIGPDLMRYNNDQVSNTARGAIAREVSEGRVGKLSTPVHYIAAERDVRPEGDGGPSRVNPDGSGATNLVRELLTTAGVSKEPVEKGLLNDLNSLLAPDHRYSRIQVQRHRSTGAWEIFLQEDGKGLVPLSQCGSGLRTLVHLLVLTNLIAKRSGEKISQGTFLFEELENCLHPHVQRNLFAYLDDVIELPARVFLTTHSAVCLDYFQGHNDVTLTHVFQRDGKTRSRPIEAFEDRCGVLDRMGSRASEALQSNAVIWVEGPSDRTYIKHWFDLLGGRVVEGRDYSVMFYGGDLLAHLTMDADTEVQEYIKLLRINRNSAIIIDSDKTYQAEPIRETKRRVKEEAEQIGKIAWITRGKEIENYLQPAFVERVFGEAIPFGIYDPPWPRLKGKTPVGASRTLQTKVEFAEIVRRNAGANDFQLDWRERCNELLEFIRSANGRATT